MEALARTWCRGPHLPAQNIGGVTRHGGVSGGRDVNRVGSPAIEGLA